MMSGISTIRTFQSILLGEAVELPRHHQIESGGWAGVLELVANRERRERLTRNLLVAALDNSRQTEQVCDPPKTEATKSEPERELQPDLSGVEIMPSTHEPDDVSNRTLLLFALILIEECIL